MRQITSVVLKSLKNAEEQLHTNQVLQCTDDPSKVNFYATRTSSYSTQQSKIHFELDRLTSCNAVKLKMGVFTAPQDGIYHFSVAGIKDESKDPIWLYLRLDEENIAAAYSSESTPFSTYALQSILKLVKGDQIDLYLHQGKYYDSTKHWTHFTGTLFVTNQNEQSIHFYVQKNTSYSTNNNRIPYEISRTNEGNAMDINSGIFTAPVDGTYLFSFAGIKDDSKKFTRISLRLNDANIGSAGASEKTPWATFSLQSILKLNQGDNIDLFLQNGTYFDSNNHWGHFVGSLIGAADNQLLVNFYVQRNSSYSKAKSTIPYELARINDGDAMNLQTGIFVAPRDGLYRFALSGIKDDSKDHLWISLRLNGSNVASAYGSEFSSMSTYSLHSTLKLGKGDQIDLYLQEGVYYDTESHWTHFTGSLIV